MNQQQGQQVSVEDAFPVYRQKVSELFDETLILRAKVAMLEQKLAEAQAGNLLLHQAAGLPGEGPDLAAQPAYESDDRG